MLDGIRVTRVVGDPPNAEKRVQVPKPLKVPSLARSVPKSLKVRLVLHVLCQSLKVPSLARSVPKPLLIWRVRALLE